MMTSKSLCNMNFIMFLLLCLQYLAVKSQMDTINQTSLTTSPGNCFSNFECPSNKFCFFSDQNNPVHRCMRRSTAGNSCYFGGSRSADRNSNIQTCVNGLTCENNLDTGEYVCVPNLNRGDLCGISGSGECPEGDVCTKGKDGKFRCRPPTSGILGSRCPYSTHCLDNYDLFCQNKVCVRKKATGAFCKYGFQCLSGICTANGRCGSLQRQWEMCLENSHCKNSGNAFRNGNHVYCNVTPFKNELGRCIRDSELLKTLGTSCSPKFDRCDRRRGLSCEWIVSERRFGCQQITIGGLCTPNNKYSRCESNIWPMKCLIALETGEYGKEKPRFYRCFPRRVPVPVGTVCNRAHVEPECPKGTSCERIWGVLEDFSDRYGPPSIQTCLYLRGLGEQCGNRFRTKCKPGLKCEGGTCVNGTELCCPPNTHADIGLPCKTLPCIPGAECVDGWCRKISKVMKLGQPCYESVLYNAKCEQPFRCMGNYRGKGVWRCRKPRSVGGACMSDEDCASKLKCTPHLWYDPRKCYDEDKILKAGEACNPKAKKNEKRCVGPKLSCLPKGSGYSCQHVATLFEYCSPKNNTICLDSRLKCDPLTSACVSR